SPTRDKVSGRRLAVRRLRDVGEHAWIAALARRLAGRPADRRILVGPGDDAAAVRPGRRPLLVTTDALVENVHFRAGWAAPAALGRRAWAVNASDLAAMGGVPRFAVLALEAPPAMRAADLDALVGGFAAAARRAGSGRRSISAGSRSPARAGARSAGARPRSPPARARTTSSWSRCRAHASRRCAAWRRDSGAASRPSAASSPAVPWCACAIPTVASCTPRAAASTTSGDDPPARDGRAPRLARRAPRAGRAARAPA